MTIFKICLSKHVKNQACVSVHIYMDLTVLITLVSGHGVDLYEKEKLKSKKYSLLQNFQSRLVEQDTNVTAKEKFCLPDDAILQPTSDDVDRNALRLVGESQRTDDLSAVDMPNQVPVHRPQAKVAASSLWKQKRRSHNSHQGPEDTSITRR